jgi:hypothetical protein
VAGLRRRGGALAILLAAVCTATAAATLTLGPGRLAAPPDPECADAFPRLVLPGGDAGYAGLVVCSDSAGTSTLIRNDSAAVWAVDSDAPVHLMPLADRARSFTDLIDGPRSFIPSGAVGVIALPVERLGLRVDPRLTVAQLAHDQIVATLARKNGPAPAALDPRPSVARRALLVCLGATLSNVGDARLALTSDDPAGVLAEAAAAVDSQGRTFCGGLWLEAKFNANLPSGYQTTFTSDIVGWDRNAEFAERANAAAAIYRLLQAEGAG